jgi:hypothetical protein
MSPAELASCLRARARAPRSPRRGGHSPPRQQRYGVWSGTADERGLSHVGHDRYERGLNLTRVNHESQSHNSLNLTIVNLTRVNLTRVNHESQSHESQSHEKPDTKVVLGKGGCPMVPGGSDVRSACMSGESRCCPPPARTQTPSPPVHTYPAVASVKTPERPPGERTGATWVSTLGELSNMITRHEMNRHLG